MPSLAQEEADRLLNSKEHFTNHPEDRFDSADEEEGNSSSGQDPGNDEKYYHSEHDIDDDDLDDLDDTTDTITRRMMSLRRKSVNYHVPKTVFEANTGPKGVISDAQSYERAKQKTSRRTFGYDLSPAKHQQLTSEKFPPHDPSSGTEEDDDEDAFMRKWRQARMQELQQASRRGSPGRNKRKWGRLETVGANGYLDAIEQTPRSTVVVVCIYDPDVSLFVLIQRLASANWIHIIDSFITLHHPSLANIYFETVC